MKKEVPSYVLITLAIISFIIGYSNVLSVAISAPLKILGQLLFIIGVITFIREQNRKRKDKQQINDEDNTIKKDNFEKSKIGLAILITAIVIGGAVYYFTNSKTYSEVVSTKQENISYNQNSSDIVSTKQENISYNQSSKEYAIMGRELSSAFSCSIWASHFGDQKEAERLFLFGYEQGKKFLGAVRAEKITEEDFQKEIPILISMSLVGPSDDFILGVIFTEVQNEAVEEVFYTNYDRSELHSDDLKKTIAENKYLEGNCRLIGR